MSENIGAGVLLSPLDLGARRSRNRVVFGPHETNLARGRMFSERHVAYYARRAAGGAGVIVLEEASVQPTDWPYERSPLAEVCAEGWEQVAGACHEHGALVLAAIGHSGGQGSSAYSQEPLLAPSRVPEVNSREVPKWMEPGDIAEVIDGFAAAGALAVSAGLDGIEVNAGQHSLIRQFLSGLTNQRDDEWGRDRSRFARQVLQAVRTAAGPGVVVGLRLSCDELAPWAGMVPEEAPELAAGLAEHVDYITVVRGSIYSVSATRPDTHVEPGFNVPLAAAVRAAVPARVAVVVQGSIVDPDQAEAALAAGGADAVEMTRAQISDPDLVTKLAAGRRVRPCILCNQTCQVRDVRNPIVTCVGEPRSGHETEDPDADAAPSGVGSTDPADILVVGGGPAGLECARVSASAGHRVLLVEARSQLGGMLRVAAAGAGRARLVELVGWFEEECRRLGVQIETGRSVGADEIQAHPGPVVLATGSRPGRRSYQVSPDAVVTGAAEFLENGGLVGAGPVAVWDPIGGPIGISVAESAALTGRAVHLITPDLITGNELSRSGDLAPASTRLQALGVALEKRSILRAVCPGAAQIEDRFTGRERTIEAAIVIDAGHRLPEDSLWSETAAQRTVVRAGDCVAPRSVLEAVLEGRRAALAHAGAGR